MSGTLTEEESSYPFPSYCGSDMQFRPDSIWITVVQNLKKASEHQSASGLLIFLFLVLFLQWPLSLYTKIRASLLGAQQCHLAKGKKKKSVLLKSIYPSPLLLADGSPLCPLDLVFSLWILLGTVAVFYQPVIMSAILGGLCVCTDAVFEHRMGLPSLGSRHGQIGDPGLHSLNKHPHCSSLSKISVSAEVGKQQDALHPWRGSFFLL